MKNLKKITEVKVRRAHVSDAEFLHNIESIVYGKSNWSVKTFQSEITNMYSRYFLVLNTKDEILGYIGYWKVGEEAHITNLAIKLEYQGMNLSDILLYTTILESNKENIKWLTLEVRQSNFKAINLYNKYGFKQIGIRKNYYQDNKEDALILWTGNINTQSYQEKAKENLSSLQVEIIT